MPATLLVRILARSFLSGPPNVEEIVSRASFALGKPWRWLRPLAKRYLKVVAGRPRPRHRDVVQFLRNDSQLRRILSRHQRGLSIAHFITGPQPMQPVAAAKNWPVPQIESVGALAQWLQITPTELQWFADLKGLGHRESSSKLRHYHYRILAKQSGNIRLIEAPKRRLKEIQRQILNDIVEKIPAHPAVHGFVKTRSIKTFAAPHTNKRVVLRVDLRDFFPSFIRARIRAMFRTMGYPESVADLLGGLCTTITPRDIWTRAAFGEDPLHLWESRWQTQAIYFQPHLPQGAPTSPALANLCAYRLDCRLAGLAEAAGATYTRYADDLAFSGGEDFEKRVVRSSLHVAAIALEEDFQVHHRKTRIMRQGVCQHLAGIVINQHMNVRRADFDRLKAILTNCVRLGPASQNRDAISDFRLHLVGRVGFVEMINPAKGSRLRRIFEQINWA
ncbi:MAG TPA: reverse transcriptase family protein [Candidatus Angelobacter sp.]